MSCPVQLVMQACEIRDKMNQNGTGIFSLHNPPASLVTVRYHPVKSPRIHNKRWQLNLSFPRTLDIISFILALRLRFLFQDCDARRWERFQLWPKQLRFHNRWQVAYTNKKLVHSIAPGTRQHRLGPLHPGQAGSILAELQYCQAVCHGTVEISKNGTCGK